VGVKLAAFPASRALKSGTETWSIDVGDMLALGLSVANAHLGYLMSVGSISRFVRPEYLGTLLGLPELFEATLYLITNSELLTD
jgi:hypothetical protein